MDDIHALQKIAENYLEEYNSTSSAPMKLVLFLDAVEHLARICRVIRLPLGNALLLGVGGSGRQSLTRLAAFVEEYEIFQVFSSTLSLLMMKLINVFTNCFSKIWQC